MDKVDKALVDTIEYLENLIADGKPLTEEQKILIVSAKDLRYLLFNWLEEVNYKIITEGFAIARFVLDISKNSLYRLTATVYGEEINLDKHHFKIEVKAPTFHLMNIKQNGGVTMQFLLDL